MRLIELQNESDSLGACAAAERAGADPNLRGWAALVPVAPDGALVFLEGLRHAGLAVLQGGRAALVLGSIAQIWGAARSLEDGLERDQPKRLARELRDRAAAVEAGPPIWKLRSRVLPAGRTLVMGIVNVTSDSFSDGGQLASAEQAIAHAQRLVGDGADIIDVGGESTRPSAAPVSAEVESARVLPVVRALAEAGVVVSIDTTKASVARLALDAGAEIVNDISALRDEAMAPLIAEKSAAVCLMHLRGTPADMQTRAVYRDLLGEVLAELAQALERARDIAPERIALDPGLGFAKTGAHNLLLLRRQRELTQLGRPLVVGPSRKSFLGHLTGKPPAERVIGTVAAAVLAAAAGASIVRVHDVAAVREALTVSDAIRTSRS